MRHFVDDDVQHLYDQALIQCHRLQGQDLLSFGDRYLTAMKRAGRNPDKVGEYSTMFMSELP